jgi:isopenicillin N synthase-like dioxygenase
MAAIAKQPSMPQFDTTTKDEAWAGAKSYLESRLQNPQSSESSKSFQIPIIDLEPSFSEHLHDRVAVANQIRSACVESGFFYITSHGISESAISGILNQAKRLMALPREKKQSLHVKNSPYYTGYEPPESTSLNGDAETKEGWNWAYEEGLDPTGGDGKYVQLDGQKRNANQWPNEQDVPGFYDGVKEYYGGVWNALSRNYNLTDLHFFAGATAG